MDAAQVFEELYCISDLHLGGRQGFQIFTQGDLLAQFFDDLRTRDPAKAIVLVINGDFVDFLAEADGQRIYLDSAGAATKLQRISNDPTFKNAFAALGAYLRTESRFLAITLGNHDLELALPEVQQALVQILAGTDLKAVARLHLALDGTGFSARVGAANSTPVKVLAVHGNEADLLNVTDHEALRQHVRDLRWGRVPKNWAPNAGTKLVIDVMNDVKGRFPLVDLVKPEFAAVLPILLALEPALASRIRDLGPVLRRLIGTTTRRAFGLLGQESNSPPVGGAAFRTFEVPSTKDHEEVDAQVTALLAEADRRFAQGVHPLALVASERELLGGWGLMIDLFRDRDPRENLRDSLLGWLKSSPSGALDEPDRTFETLGQEAGRSIDVVLTGHTHRPRALVRQEGGLYFNSGAWIDRIELDPSDLQPSRFEAIYAAMSDRDPQRLRQVPGLVRRQPAVVHLALAEEKVRGQLSMAILRDGRLDLEKLHEPLEVEGR